MIFRNSRIKREWSVNFLCDDKVCLINLLFFFPQQSAHVLLTCFPNNTTSPSGNFSWFLGYLMILRTLLLTFTAVSLIGCLPRVTPEDCFSRFVDEKKISIVIKVWMDIPDKVAQLIPDRYLQYMQLYSEQKLFHNQLDDLPFQ